MTRPTIFRFAVCVAAALAALPVHSQIYTLTKEQMIEYTAQNPFERFPDGRPKVPDSIIERAKGLSAEEVWNVLPGKNFRKFMPARPDIESVMSAKARDKGAPRGLNNQFAIDMLQPGDVLIVDLFGKKEGGTIVGDNLFYYVMKATKGGGLIVDGSIRDLEGISEMDMPAYFRSAHPSAIANVMLTGINVPVRIGNVTVMPGDLVVGDREGIYFIPPQFAKEVVDKADTVHVHDEWTRKKFDEGKYKSSEIYGSPRDPALLKEYNEYLAKRLAEIQGKK